MSRWANQAPARMCQSNAARRSPGRLQMFGDQRGVLVGRIGVALFDRGGQPPVQFGALRLQLRFVGHRADQRMPKRILARAE